jgi:glycosyltransferase involved in cell wall biosynthesis
VPKKKILIFIDWFTPGYKAGGPIRSVANIIEHFEDDMDLEFKIITSDTDYLETESYSEIESNKWLNYNDNTQIYYFSKDKLNYKNLKILVSQTDFDSAYTNGIYSYYFSILPVGFVKQKNKAVIVAARGMISEHAFSSKNIKKKLFLTVLKLIGFYKNVHFQATDEKEETEIKKIFAKNQISVIPNLPKKNNLLKCIGREKQKGNLNLISIARISIEKNTLFALQILANLNTIDKIVFDIYGSIYNEDYFKECKKNISRLPENIEVNYKGSIENEKVSETFSQYHFAFMPSKGENFGHSILESLSAGCPVLISDQTPWRNLEEKRIGWDIALSDVKKFVKVLENCAEMGQEEYNMLSDNAFEFAKKTTQNPENVELTKQLFLNA